MSIQTTDTVAMRSKSKNAKLDLKSGPTKVKPHDPMVGKKPGSPVKGINGGIKNGKVKV